MPEYPTYPGPQPEGPGASPERPPGSSNPPPPPPPPPGGYPPNPGAYPSPQNPYPAPGGYGQLAPKHHNAVTAMVLGIVSLVGTFMCCIPALLGPVAWYLGSKAVTQIDASGGAIGGRSEAMAGKVLGIIGTVLLALLVLLVVFFVVLTIQDPTMWDD